MPIVQAPTRSLAHAPSGRYVCAEVHAVGDHAVRLKRLGICQGRSIELLATRDPMILQIGNSRVGLSRQLADFVTVSHSNCSGIDHPLSTVASAVAVN